MMIWFILLSVIASVYCIKVEVKMVDSHAQIGQTSNQGFLKPRQLTLSKDPAPLCAHSSLNQLKGKCYSVEVDKYRYEVCPFHNITQHEIANRWNAYHGILGVWSHWTYKDTYSVLDDGIYTGGDPCQKDDKQIARSVTLQHVCGKQTAVTNVSEPETCQYLISLTCPLFCHSVFSDVLSALSPTSQSSYARLTMEFRNNILTQEGLELERIQLLQGIGCLSKDRSFDDLHSCTSEFNDLNNKYQKLLKDYKLLLKSSQYDELKLKYDELHAALEENGLILPNN